MRAAAKLLALLLLAGQGCGGARPHDERAPAPSAPAPRAAADAAAPVAAPQGALVAEYAVRYDGNAGTLAVDVRFAAGVGGALAVDRGADAFVKEAQTAPDGPQDHSAAWRPVSKNGRAFHAAPCASGPCRVRYRYDLKTAAKRVDDVDVASEEGAIIEAPPSTWLLVPTNAPRDALVRFRVTTTDGTRFVTGVFPAKDATDAWDISLDDLWTSPYSAFGSMRVRDVAAKDGHVQLAIAPGGLAVTDDQLAQWTSDAARAVSLYFGKFPMPHALVLLVPSNGRGVGGGKTLAGGGGTVMMHIGDTADWGSYHEDWVLVHEMTHLTFPTAPRGGEWAEEGLATYVEPFARVRAGLLSEEDAWRGLVDGLPNGLPAAGDQGLDRTHTWGRTYWGGALFYFLADIDIRERTQNRFGLEHALRGILEAGGNDAVRWPLEKSFEVGDRAIGVPALKELHDKMGTAAYPVDLAAITKSLGVAVSHGKVQFDPKAPRAAIRKAITLGQ